MKSWSISPGLRRLTYSLYIADVPDNLMEDLLAASLPPDWRSIYPPPSKGGRVYTYPEGGAVRAVFPGAGIPLNALFCFRKGGQ